VVEIQCDDNDVWVGEQQMCDFMQKRYNGCSGRACGPEGKLVIKGERCLRFLEVWINDKF